MSTTHAYPLPFDYLGSDGQWHTRDFERDSVRRDLEDNRYTKCLGCGDELTIAADRRTGTHERCWLGHHLEAVFIRPGEESCLDQFRRFVCAGCGGFFTVPQDKRNDFPGVVRAWARKHAECMGVASLRQAA